jgi:hypothetical protein
MPSDPLPTSLVTKSQGIKLNQSGSVYLSLDFDGVLHHHDAGLLRTDVFDPGQSAESFIEMLEQRFPAVITEPFFNADGKLFDRQYFLECVLEQLPLAKVVIATSWRYQIPPDRIGDFLSPIVRERIVGTLDHSEQERKIEGQRGVLMKKWLCDNGVENAVWLGIDDQIRHYALHPENAFKTHWRGLKQEDVDRIVSKVASLCGSTLLCRGDADTVGMPGTGLSYSENESSTS